MISSILATKSSFEVTKNEKQAVLNFSQYILNGHNTTAKSSYRYVFSDLRKEFKNFLETIFFQLDTRKVFEMMDEILADPGKTDENVYQELLERVGSTKKRFAPFFEAFKALPILAKGMGKQVAEHLKEAEKTQLQDYLEVSTRRYVKGIEKQAKLSFKKVVALSDEISVNLIKRFEANALFYPYTSLIHLNDQDCNDYNIETEKTYKPIGKEIDDKSLDLIACLGGLHHIPQERVEPFVQSLYAKLRPGAILLLRDHNAGSDKVKALASVVHSFVNAVAGLSLKGELAEIRNFQPEDYWISLLKKKGFNQINQKSLVLQDDPTENAMTAFVKLPTTKEEVEEAAVYRKNYQRSKIGSYATWIEWGNVRFEKQYAEFIQNHHSYAFDSIGHMRQHWAHFYNAVKSSLSQPDVKIQDFLFSDNTVMNLFILFGTTGDLAIRALTSFPSACIARVRYGENWRNVANLSALEKFEAKFKSHYSQFIDYDPFFKYPYFKTIKEMWSTIYQSQDGIATKVGDILGGTISSVTLGVQGILSAFINHIYYSSGGSSDLETTHYLIDDPKNELGHVIDQWNKQKMMVEFEGKKPFERCDIQEVYNVQGRKLISVPFYKPFMEITKLIAETDIKLIKAGGQEKITLDLWLDKGEENPAMEGAQVIYELDRLQDQHERRYVTYEVLVSRLPEFCRQPNVKNHIEYIHVHR